jgi:predicted ester cyclase
MREAAMPGAEFVNRVMTLWSEPLQDNAEQAFRQVYADPVTVNGVEMSVADLVARARHVQRALSGLTARILDVVQAPERVVVAFELQGRHTGPWTGPFGTVEATGRDVAVRTIDVLTVVDGRITGLWVVSDELGLLAQLGVGPAA